MGVSPIVAAIHAEGLARIADIQSQAEAHAEEILYRAHAEAEALYTQARDTAVPRIEQERASILHAAHMEAEGIESETLLSLTKESLSLVQDKLTSMRKNAHYPEIMRHLICEAMHELCTSHVGVGDPTWKADMRDKEIVEKLQASEFPHVNVFYDLKCTGGICAQSEDGRIIVVNTMESRFERAKSYLQSYLTAFFKENVN